MPGASEHENRLGGPGFVTEFTGERVIPGQVNDDLWAEHIARYAFAARLASGSGCWIPVAAAGYGVNEPAGSAAWIVGADVSRRPWSMRGRMPPNEIFLLCAPRQRRCRFPQAHLTWSPRLR